MGVEVEGRRSRCWGCKQLGQVVKFCPPKDQQNAAVTTVSEQPTKGTKEKYPSQIQSKTIDHPKTDEGWTEVTRKKDPPPKKTEERRSANASPSKNPEPEPVSHQNPQQNQLQQHLHRNQLQG